MNEIEKFELEVSDNIKSLGKNNKLKKKSIEWIKETGKHKYSYNFKWMGRPIIQYPQDIIAMQEIIWSIKPDLIIETGIAHGGSIIFYSSMLELINKKGKVIGIDVDIREHNRKEIENHVMFKKIKLIEGSSIDQSVINQVKKYIEKNQCEKIIVILDSNHTHDHVLEELKLYSNFVSKGSYIVVFDTVIDYMPSNYFNNRSWGKNNNPNTAVKEFLKENNNFVIDKKIENKLLISVAINGYLKRII